MVAGHFQHNEKLQDLPADPSDVAHTLLARKEKGNTFVVASFLQAPAGRSSFTSLTVNRLQLPAINSTLTHSVRLIPILPTGVHNFKLVFRRKLHPESSSSSS